MNPSDIETMNKLKELRDKGVLTQEEFDEQIAVCLNANKNEKIAESKDDKFSFSWIVSVILTIVSTISYILYLICAPNCGDNEVKKVLDGVLKENLLSNYSFSLSAFSEISSDKANDMRKCKANIVINGQSENIIYTVKNTDLYHFSVDLDDDSYDYLNYKYKLLCDNKEKITPTLFEHIEESFGIKPVSLETSKELSYDDNNYKRQCTAVLKFDNDKKEEIEYYIEKSDEQHFSVDLDDEYLNESITKQCNILSEKYAQNVISSNYMDFNNLQLDRVEFVSKNEQEDYVICKSSTNINYFPTIYYKLSKENNEIYVSLKSPFECNRASMMIAQALIVSNYDGLKDITLRNPQKIKEDGDVLTCKVGTNSKEISSVSYRLQKVDGQNYANIDINLFSDVVDNVAEQMIEQLKNYNEWELDE